MRKCVSIFTGLIQCVAVAALVVLATVGVVSLLGLVARVLCVSFVQGWHSIDPKP